MKRGAPDHWKMVELARLAEVPIMYGVPWANGVMERLWHYAAQYTPAGNIGNVPDGAIARACSWPEDQAEKLINALCESRWLHRDPVNRLVVHDWHDHCEDSVHSKLARNHQYFCDGTAPKITGLRTKEAEEARLFYTENNRSSVTQPVINPLQPVTTEEQPVATDNQPVATRCQPVDNPLASASASASALASASASAAPAKPQRAPTPIHPGKPIPQDAERRIRSLADVAPDQQDYERGVDMAIQHIVNSANPETTLVAMEANIPAWWEAMRDGRARTKPMRFVIVDLDYLRRPREQSAHRNSNGRYSTPDIPNYPAAILPGPDVGVSIAPMKIIRKGQAK